MTMHSHPPLKLPPAVLSIQSYVAYGYVGNRAAVFPLQRLGFDVTAINTVQFSNHTGYGDWQGEIFTPQHLQQLMEGLKSRSVLPQLQGLLSGYMGSPELGAFIRDTALTLKSINPDLLYCCDPVIGDVGRGVFVRPGVGDYFKQHLVPLADILTPNLFELNYLTGAPVDTLAQVQHACELLHQMGPRMILVTSLCLDTTPAHAIQMLISTKEQGSFLIETPRFELHPAPNGAGDLTAALFFAHALQGASPAQALAKTAEAVFAVFEATAAAQTRELQLIAAQDGFAAPHPRFCPLVV